MSETNLYSDSQEIDHLYIVNRNVLLDHNTMASYQILETTVCSSKCFTLLLIVFSLFATFSYIIIIIKK